MSESMTSGTGELDDASVTEILTFWFGEDDQVQKRWFVKSEAFDQEIRQRFGHLVARALASSSGPPTPWRSVDEALARILLLDQFTRNIHRDTPAAFAGDETALQLAQSLVDSGQHQSLGPLRRWFAYMPFEHAEDAAIQARSVELFTRLVEDARSASSPCLADLESALDYALKHQAVVDRFGRFPHRNAILGRASSAEELEFLEQPGSSF